MDSVHQQHCSFREYSVGELRPFHLVFNSDAAKPLYPPISIIMYLEHALFSCAFLFLSTFTGQPLILRSCILKPFV